MKADTIISEPPKFPVETWETIFWNVARSGDLYNVALASHYFHDVVKPILYQRLYLDPNPYSVYTLSLLKREASLTKRVTRLMLLPPINRTIPSGLAAEVECISLALDIPHHPLTSLPPPIFSPSSWMVHPLEGDAGFRPVYHFFPTFTSLTTLNIVGDRLPSDFLNRIRELPQLVTLNIRDSLVSATLEQGVPAAPLRLRDLSIVGCRTKADLTEIYVTGILCEGLIKNSPSLTSLTVDLFVERAACHVLADLENPPPVRVLKCHGMSHHDVDCALLSSVLCALPTIVTLHMARTPRELAPLLPSTCLPNLKTLTGQIKSIAVFSVALRGLQYLTITDAASSGGAGGTPWETQLIQFLESLKRIGTDIKGLSFNVGEWSEELFLCVCQLWPGLKELKIQCTTGKGVDEYFRISFGPRFLPELQNFELLHIFERPLKHGFTKHKMSKGVPVLTCSPLSPSALDPDEAEEIAEAPIHLKRWEKLCPSLREVAFDREAWWRRLEPGGWVLRSDVLPALTEDAG